MIIGVTGYPTKRMGNGKGIYSTFLVLRAQLKYGLPIYSNMHLYNVDYTFLENADDLFEIDRGIILLDDLYRAFMLGNHRILRRVSLLWSGASRKTDQYIVYTSSRLIDYIEKNIRANTEIYATPFYDPKSQTVTTRFFNNMEESITPNLPAFLSKAQVNYIFTKYNHREVVNVWSL
jgi:hypothetical protein